MSDTITERCEAKGLRMTEQRRVIAQVLEESDDHPDAVNRRLDLYESQTAPLIEHYTEQDRLVIVDGVGLPEEVFRRLTEAIAKRR